MPNLLFSILADLSDGRFHSGEALAKKYNISRVSVWNAVSEAEKIGVDIFSVRGKGYKLTQPITLMDEKIIKKAIGENASWLNVEVLDIVDSTNTLMMQKAATGYPHASCLVANIQTAGKGRRGRRWESALGQNLTFSFLWRFTQGAAMLSGLSLVIGIALIRAFQKVGLNQALLKWPNDVLIFHENIHKKLAGILIELQGDMEGQSIAVIGIGINLDLSKKQKDKIDQPAIDIKSCVKDKIEPNELLALIIKELATALSDFETKGFVTIKEEWKKYHAFQDKVIALTKGDGQIIHGRVSDISDDGAIVISNEKGEQTFSSGEVSIMKERVGQ